MPEVVEVYYMAKQVDEKFNSLSLTDLVFDKPPGKKTYNCSYETLDQLKKLLPLKLLKSRSHGKKIILELEKEVYIVISPLMFGSIIFDSEEAKEHCHEHFIFEQKIQFHVHDRMHEALINTYFTKQTFETKMKEIGPDFINHQITLEDFSAKIKNKRIKTQDLAKFLLDPKRISGIGNYLKAEILYDAELYPGKLISELKDPEIERLYNSCKKIIQLAFQGKGLTIKDYKTPNNEVGTYQTKVYKKDLDLLGNKVEKAKFKDGRTTHYVPAIQKI